MKTLKLISKLTFALLLTVSIIWACKKNTDDVTGDVNLNTSSHFKFEGIPLNHQNANVVHTPISDGVEKPINILSTELSSVSFNQILEKTTSFFDLENNINQKPVRIIMYLKTGVFDNISMENIEGISIFTQQSENLVQHTLYRKNIIKKLEIDNKYTSECGSLLKSDFWYLATSVLQKNNSLNWVDFLDMSQIKNTTNLTSELDGKFTKMLLDNTDKLSNVMGDGCAMSPLGYPCGPSGGDRYCASASPNDPFYCQEGGCIAETTVNEGSKNNKSMRIAQTLDLNNIRNFRDNYMVKTKKGREYVALYNKMSQIVRALDVINVDNAYEHLIVAQELVEAIDKVTSGKDNEIIIDNDAKEKYLQLISKYKNVTKNKEYQVMLKTFETDINNLSLKNKKAVEQYIK